MRKLLRLAIACVLVIVAPLASGQSESTWFEPDFEYPYGEIDGVGYEKESVNSYHRVFAPIHIAAARGDVEIVLAELQKGVPVDLQVVGKGNWKNEDGVTPLQIAAQFGRYKVLQVLIDAGANVNTAHKQSGATALMAAAGSQPTIGGDNLACMKVLIDNGADLNAKNIWGGSVIHFAAGSVSMGLMYIPDGAKPQESIQPSPFKYLRPKVGGGIGGGGEDPSRAIHLSRSGDASRLKYLINAGLDVNVRATKGETPLYIAARAPDPLRVQLLLQAGAEINPVTDYGYTALTNAAVDGWGDVFRILLAASEDVNATKLLDDQHNILLLAAGARRDAGDKVQAMLDAGFDLDPNSDLAHRALFTSLKWWRKGDAAIPLLNLGVDPFIRYENGDSLLHLAATGSDLRVLEKLLEFEFDVNERADEEERLGATPLILAASSERDAAEKVQLLLDQGADVSVTTINGISALHAAASIGNMHAVVLLVKAGADVNQPYPPAENDERGGSQSAPEPPWMPLMHVAYRGEDIFLSEETGEDAARALIAAGADVNAALESGETALTFAVQSEQPEVVRILLDAGAKPNVLIKEGSGVFISETTILNMTIEYEDTDALAALLDAGADPNWRPGEVWMDPLQYACLTGNSNFVRLLLDAGADVEARDTLGRTPLIVTASEDGSRYGYYEARPLEVLKILLDHGAIVESSDQKGMTALMHLCETFTFDDDDEDAHPNAVRLLLEGGADVHAKDSEGKTPLHHAAEGRHREVIDILLAAGADLRALDSRGRNALDIARMRWRKTQWTVPSLEYLEELFKR